MRIMSIVGAIMVLAACGPAQSDECKKMIECETAYADAMETTATDWEDSYGPKGTCWKNAGTADSCTEACTNTVDSYKTALEAASKDVPSECN